MGKQTSSIERAKTLIAKLRHRQLAMALAGRVRDSAHYAHLADRVRRASHARTRCC
jgi:hypothetical protein